MNLKFLTTHLSLPYMRYQVVIRHYIIILVTITTTQTITAVLSAPELPRRCPDLPTIRPPLPLPPQSPRTWPPSGLDPLSASSAAAPRTDPSADMDNKRKTFHLDIPKQVKV